MDVMLQSLRAELNTLAENANCSRAKRFLGQWYAQDKLSRAWLALGGDSDPSTSDLRRELSGSWPDLESATDGMQCWLADRLVVTYPAGEMPSADVLNSLSTSVFARPSGTVALALTGAEKINSAEDLRLVEALAVRWLLRPSSSQGNLPLRERGGFLCSTERATDAGLQDRLSHDLGALQQWLRGPLAPQVQLELDQARMRFACEIAEAEISTTAPNASLTRNQVCDVQTDLEQLRDRVLSRLRSDADSLELSVRVASEALEQDLLAGLPQFFHDNPQILQDSTLVDSAFIAYCESVIHRWELQPRNAARQWGRVVEELATQVRSSPVWQRATPATHDRPFQENIIAILEHSRLEFIVPPVRPEEQPATAASRSIEGIVVTIAGTLLGAGAGLVTGFGPPAMAAGGGLGALCGVLFRRHNLQQERKASLEQAARQEVIRISRVARAALTQVVYDHTQHLRRELSEVFLQAQQALDQTLSSALQGDSQALNARDALASLRRRIEELNA